MTLPEGAQGFVVHYDASRLGLGCELMYNDNIKTYASKVHEKNYPTHNLELDVVVFILKMWSRYLYDVHVYAFTDHKSLQFVFSLIEFNLKQRRWLDLLKNLT